MERSPHLNTSQRVGVHDVNTLVFRPLFIGEAIAKALRGLSAKAIAAKLRKIGGVVSARTVESWKQAKRTPRAEHVMAMMADEDLCALILEPVNPELAHQAKVIAAKKKLRELEER